MCGCSKVPACAVAGADDCADEPGGITSPSLLQYKTISEQAIIEDQAEGRQLPGLPKLEAPKASKPKLRVTNKDGLPKIFPPKVIDPDWSNGQTSTEKAKGRNGLPTVLPPKVRDPQRRQKPTGLPKVQPPKARDPQLRRQNGKRELPKISPPKPRQPQTKNQLPQVKRPTVGPQESRVTPKSRPTLIETKFKKQDLMIQEDVENTADEKEDMPSDCNDCMFRGEACSNEKNALCDKFFRLRPSPTLRCGAINKHRIFTEAPTLCVPEAGGNVIYKGEPCGANTEMAYLDSDGETHYAQNIQWVSAKAVDIRSGLSEAQCKWIWGDNNPFYAGSCGVQPEVRARGRTHFPKTCWPDEIAKERANSENDRVRAEKEALTAEIAELSKKELGLLGAVEEDAAIEEREEQEQSVEDDAA